MALGLKLSVLSLADALGGINGINNKVILIDTQSHSALYRDSTLRHATLTSCILLNCKISDCVLKNCKLVNCIIDKSWIEDSETKCCQSITAVLAFRRFPAEIRQKIFWATLQGYEWQSGRAPSLVMALRGDQTLYKEVLEAYYRFAGFRLSEQTSMSWVKMPSKITQKIERLSVDAASICCETPENFSALLEEAQSIRYLNLTFSFNDRHAGQVEVGSFYGAAIDWMMQLKSVKQLSVVFDDNDPVNSQSLGWLDLFNGRREIDLAVRMANSAFGIQAIMTADIKGTVTWLWIAAEGEALKWTCSL